MSRLRRCEDPWGIAAAFPRCAPSSIAAYARAALEARNRLALRPYVAEHLAGEAFSTLRPLSDVQWARGAEGEAVARCAGASAVGSSE